MTGVVSTGPIQASAAGIVVIPDTLRAVLHERRGGGEGSVALASIGIAITIWITFATATFENSVVRSSFLLSGIGFSIAAVFFFIKYLIKVNWSSINSIVLEVERRSIVSNVDVRPK